MSGGQPSPSIESSQFVRIWGALPFFDGELRARPASENIDHGIRLVGECRGWARQLFDAHAGTTKRVERFHKHVQSISTVIMQQ